MCHADFIFRVCLYASCLLYFFVLFSPVFSHLFLSTSFFSFCSFFYLSVYPKMALATVSLPKYGCSWEKCQCVSVLLLLLKKLATFNPLLIVHCNGSVTVTSYCYFKCTENVTSYYKTSLVTTKRQKVTGYIAEPLLRYILSVLGVEV